MASTSQYTLAPSPLFVSGSNVGIGTRSPVYTFQVNGDISGTRLCIGSDCRDQWPRGTLAGTGSAGQVTFWTGPGDLGGDNNLFWDNLNKRLGIGTITPQTSLHVVGNITANTFLGTINAANVSSGQFGANTGGGNYSFPGNVGIGTTAPNQKLRVSGGNIWLDGNYELGWDWINTDRASIRFESTSDASGASKLIIETWDNADEPIEFRQSGNVRMVISNIGPGNVGIGTTAPGYKLELAKPITGAEALLSLHNTRNAWGSSGDSVGLNFVFNNGAGSPQEMANIYANVFDLNSGFERGRLFFRVRDYNVGGMRDAMVIEYNGNVGIGTTAPGYRLHVVGNVGVTDTIWKIGDWGVYLGGTINPTNVVRVGEIYGGSGLYAPNTGITLDSGAASPYFKVSYANSAKFYIDSAGNVGIGTTAPGYKLDVAGDVRWSGSVRNNIIVPSGFFACIGTDYCGDAPLNGLKVGFGGIFLPGTAGTNQLKIDWGNLVVVNGNVGIGTTVPAAKLHVISNDAYPHAIIAAGSGAPYGSFLSLNATAITGGKDWFIFSTGGSASEGTGKLVFKNQTDGVYGLTIQSNGNVGIGTTAPSEKLEIVGNIKFEPSALRFLYLGSGGGYIRTGDTAGSWIHLEAANSPGVAINWLSNTKRVAIGGNVGIGTTAPGYKLEINGTLGYTGGTGPFCIFANACPNGWVDKGLGGYIYDAPGGATCPYIVGGDFFSWKWCHPRICCQW
jgi:hypothetical protein